uniref:Uncharacterized protein n=1 Tax=viral metagenome TaxID=1070528 RepID=A0A6C0KQ61_9ZZZZ
MAAAAMDTNIEEEIPTTMWIPTTMEERGFEQTMGAAFAKDILLPLTCRQESKKCILNASTAQPLSLLQNLTSMLTHCVGKDTIECLKIHYNTLRASVEHSKPTTQCNNIIGEPDNCWICGGEIILNHKNLGPECEHVFPIAQALVFTGLYEHALFETLSDKYKDAYKTGLQLEYRWAHRICNQVKNDTHFIDYKDNDFVIDREKIKDFINKLIDTKSYGTGEKLCIFLGKSNYKKGGESNYKKGKALLEKRVNEIASVCTPIIKIVKDLGLSATQHAQSTIIYVQQYIAKDPQCGGMVASLPVQNNVVPIIPTVGTRGPLSRITPDLSIALFNMYFYRCSNIWFGTYHAMLYPILKSNRIRAKQRLLISQSITEMESEFKNPIKEKFMRMLPTFGINLLTYLQRKYASIKNERERETKIWSRYQALTTQLIPIYTITSIYDYFRDYVKEKLQAKLQAKSYQPNSYQATSHQDISVMMIELLDGKQFKRFKDEQIRDYTEKVYHVVLDTPNMPTSGNMPANVLQEIDKILESTRQNTNTPIPNWFQNNSQNQSMSEPPLARITPSLNLGVPPNMPKSGNMSKKTKKRKRTPPKQLMSEPPLAIKTASLRRSQRLRNQGLRNQGSPNNSLNQSNNQSNNQSKQKRSRTTLENPTPSFRKKV